MSFAAGGVRLGAALAERSHLSATAAGIVKRYATRLRIKRSLSAAMLASTFASSWALSPTLVEQLNSGKHRARRCDRQIAELCSECAARVRRGGLRGARRERYSRRDGGAALAERPHSAATAAGIVTFFAVIACGRRLVRASAGARSRARTSRQRPECQLELT
jgi:hypothetical protein